MPETGRFILSRRLALQTSAVVLGFAFIGAMTTRALQKYFAKRQFESELAELDLPMSVQGPNSYVPDMLPRPDPFRPQPSPPTNFPTHDPNAPTPAELRLRQLVTNPPPERRQPIVQPQAPVPAPAAPAPVPKAPVIIAPPPPAAPKPPDDFARRAKAQQARAQEISKAQNKVMTLSQDVAMKKSVLARTIALRDFIRRDLRSRDPSEPDPARREQINRDVEMAYNKVLNEVQKAEGLKIMADKELQSLKDKPADE